MVNTDEVFDNPDEYHIVTKRGKAIVSGNVVWAKSTLAQLIGEDGRIANVDFYDRSACPYRGVSLEKLGGNLTFEELQRLIYMMAFYKINYLKGYEKVASYADEFGFLKTIAEDLGIKVVASDFTIPNIDVVDLENNAEIAASSQVFLRAASKNGGWFYLKGRTMKDWEAMLAFSERYWRGGDAGEGTVENGLPDALSTAGTRLANFKEKVAIHRVRFQDFQY